MTELDVPTGSTTCRDDAGAPAGLGCAPVCRGLGVSLLRTGPR